MKLYKLIFSVLLFLNHLHADQNSTSFLDALEAQAVNNDKFKEGRTYFFSKLDKNTEETKNMFGAILRGDTFGIIPYKTNFILPLSWSKDNPTRVYEMNPEEAAPTTYSKNIEVEFQLSLQKELSYNLFGFHEYIFAAYTQKVWWQLYDASGPFRETNYEPEIFTIIPSSKKIDESLGLKAFKFGFVHESNGREGYRSRSWNRLYASGMWQWDNLFLATRLWYRLNEDKKSDAYYAHEVENSLFVVAESDKDDNPYIEDYLGYGDIRVQYFYGKNKMGLLLRNNFEMHKGAIELNYSYPLLNSTSSFFYAKLFDGYGLSLIEYDQHVTKVSFGISFSNELF